MSRYSNSALLLVGHGSTENPDSSAPTLQHADEIRRRGIFREVVCAFWKEEPSLRIVDYLIESEEVFVVPNFISEGYFTREIIPRELGLTAATTDVNGKRFHYCDPVGIHPTMTRLLANRAREIAPGIKAEDSALIIVGHGTGLNAKSVEAIKTQVELLKAQQLPVREVLDAYMEEPPFIAKWDELTDAENVVVVPFFIADALHSFQDIPVLLGIENELPAAASQSTIFRENPIRRRDRNLYYSRAIGTDASLVDVILDQVYDFDAPEPLPPNGSRKVYPLPSKLGEVTINAQPDGEFHLRHAADDSAQQLQVGTDPYEAREIAKHDADGEFRPLHAVSSLKRGWELRLSSEADVRVALNEFYPGALGSLTAELNGDLRVVPLREICL
ncbi:MAG: CbiX/SirB N-terminal domain-containing protein [Verrucomicrobiota bacterium]